jgi:D-arginine dehydrogenase
MDAWVDDLDLAEGLQRFSDATTMEVTRVDRSWAGLRTFARDRSPVIGFDPAAPDFFWSVGQGGYGIQTAPAWGELAANLLCGASTDKVIEGLDIGALNPKRFA